MVQYWEVVKSFSQEIKKGLVICSDKEWLIQMPECCFSESELKLKVILSSLALSLNFYLFNGNVRVSKVSLLETSQANLAFGSRQSTAFLAKENKRGC